MRTEADQVLNSIAKALFDDGYLRTDRTMSAADVLGPFSKMRDDAAANRSRPTVASGKEVALAFLKATVEDPQRPMSERMDAASLLMRDEEEK